MFSDNTLNLLLNFSNVGWLDALPNKKLLKDVVTGEIVYGAFTSVTTTGHSTTDVMVLCYYAK